MKWPFKKQYHSLRVDIHSHLIPGIDDGAQSISDSLEMLRAFKNLGFEKIVTTPHIHPNFPNTKDRIMEGYSVIQDEITKNNIGVEVEVAAEYYVDESFLKSLESNSPLLSFGDRMVLIECSFLNKPLYFEEAIFKMQSAGYRPVFAHPERYRFLEDDISWLKELKQTDILFQVTLSSLVGYYGKQAQQLGMKLIKEGMVDFLASDIHRLSQFEPLKKGLELREVQKLLSSGVILNESLL